jgi:hypothetical protein
VSRAEWRSRVRTVSIERISSSRAVSSVRAASMRIWSRWSGNRSRFSREDASNLGVRVQAELEQERTSDVHGKLREEGRGLQGGEGRLDPAEGGGRGHANVPGLPSIHHDPPQAPVIPSVAHGPEHANRAFADFHVLAVRERAPGIRREGVGEVGDAVHDVPDTARVGGHQLLENLGPDVEAASDQAPGGHETQVGPVSGGRHPGERRLGLPGGQGREEHDGRRSRAVRAARILEHLNQVASRLLVQLAALQERDGGHAGEPGILTGHPGPHPRGLRTDEPRSDSGEKRLDIELGLRVAQELQERGGAGGCRAPREPVLEVLPPGLRGIERTAQDPIPVAAADLAHAGPEVRAAGDDDPAGDAVGGHRARHGRPRMRVGQEERAEGGAAVAQEQLSMELPRAAGWGRADGEPRSGLAADETGRGPDVHAGVHGRPGEHAPRDEMDANGVEALDPEEGPGLEPEVGALDGDAGRRGRRGIDAALPDRCRRTGPHPTVVFQTQQEPFAATRGAAEEGDDEERGRDRGGGREDEKPAPPGPAGASGPDGSQLLHGRDGEVRGCPDGFVRRTVQRRQAQQPLVSRLAALAARHVGFELPRLVGRQLTVGQERQTLLVDAATHDSRFPSSIRRRSQRFARQIL